MASVVDEQQRQRRRRRCECAARRDAVACDKWICINATLRCLFAGQEPPYSFQSVHHQVYQLCTRGLAENVLHNIHDAMHVHMLAVQDALLLQHRDQNSERCSNTHDSSNDTNRCCHLAFMRCVLHHLQRYRAALRLVANVFFYIDEQHAWRVQRTSLCAMGELVAYNVLFRNDAIVSRLCSEVEYVARDGAEGIAAAHVSDDDGSDGVKCTKSRQEGVLHCYASMLRELCGGHAYVACVMQPFVHALVSHYDVCANARQETGTVTQYVAWVSNVLAVERSRARRLFVHAAAATAAMAQKAAEALENALLDRLVRQRREYLLSSATGYAALLRGGDVALVQPLVPLLSHLANGDELANMTATYVRECVDKACMGAVSADEHAGARGVSGANAVDVVEQTLAAAAHAQRLTRLLGAACTSANEQLVERALHDSVNACARFPEYLAQYVDHGMRCYYADKCHNDDSFMDGSVDSNYSATANAGVCYNSAANTANDDDDVTTKRACDGSSSCHTPHSAAKRDDAVNAGADESSRSNNNSSRSALHLMCVRVFELLRMIRDKDAFEAAMRNLLALRLVTATPRNLAAERFVVQLLRRECGASAVSRLERMIADLQCGNKSHAQLLTDTATAVALDCAAQGTTASHLDFYAVVLTGGFWPHFPALTLHTTDHMRACMHHFRQLYLSRHNGRRLTFQLSLGTVIFSLRHGGRVYQVIAPTPFVHCLLALDTDDCISTSAVCAASALGRHDVELQMSALCQAGLAMRRGAHAFAYNADFVSDETTIRVYAHTHRVAENAYRIAAPSVSSSSSAPGSAVRRAVEGEHARSLDAAIVRLLKTHRTLSLDDLCRAVAQRVALFTPTLPSIKSRLDVLIDKGFVCRGGGGGGGSSSYQYCD